MVLFISFNIFFSHVLWAWSKVFHSPFFFGLAQVRFLLFPTVKVHQEGLARIIDFQSVFAVVALGEVEKLQNLDNWNYITVYH